MAVTLAKGTPLRFSFDVWGTRTGIAKQLDQATTALEAKGLSVAWGFGGGGTYAPAKAAISANVRLLQPMTEGDAKATIATSVAMRFYFPGAIVWDTVQNAREIASSTAAGTYADVATLAKTATNAVKDGASGFGLGLGLVVGILAFGFGVAAFLYFKLLK